MPPRRPPSGTLARVPRVEHIFQLSAGLTNRRGLDSDSLYRSAQRLTIDWMQQRCPTTFPSTAYSGDAFEIDLPGQRFAATAAPNLWAARLEHPDDKIGGRTWSVETVLSRGGEAVRFGVRMLCTSIGDPGPIQRSKPRIVTDMAWEVGLREARQIDGKPWGLHSDSDLQIFESVLLDPDRQLPVILLTEVDSAKVPFKVGRFLLDENRLAQRTLGLAYVATLPAGLSFRWTEIVGREWSAFQGAVRSYRPGLSFDRDDPRDHPLTMPERIVCWTETGDWEKSYEEFLVNQAYLQSAIGYRGRKRHLTFSEVKSKSLEIAREKSNSDSEMRQLYEDEMKNLKEQAQGLEEYVAYCDVEIERYRQEIESQKRRAFDVIQENDRLRAAISDKTGRPADDEISIPDDLSELQDWAQRHLAGRLFLHPRATRAAKKSRYEDTTLVYRTLLLLARDYREMRLNRLPQEDFNTKMMELGLEFERSITKGRAGEQGDTYFIEYPVGSGQKVFLEYHLRKGHTKDDRYCLRVYFLWDVEQQQVVVGSLPAHLETRAS